MGNFHVVDCWEPTVDKFRAKLDKWKDFSMSKGGRPTIALSTLNSLPIYSSFIFKAPMKVINEIDRVVRNIFWNGGAYQLGSHCSMVILG